MTTELDSLAMQADGIDQAAAASTPEGVIQQQEQAVQMDLVQQNSRAINLIADLSLPLLGAIYPSLPGAIPDNDRKTLAAVWGPVLAKHGINLLEIGGKYAEEIAAVAATVPIALAMVKAIKADVEANNKRKPIDARVSDAPREAQQVKSAEARPVERVLPTEAPAEMAGT